MVDFVVTDEQVKALWNELVSFNVGILNDSPLRQAMARLILQSRAERDALEAENTHLRKQLIGVINEHEAHLERLLLLEKEPIRFPDFQCHNCRTIAPIFGPSNLCGPCWQNALPKCSVCNMPARNEIYGKFLCDIHWQQEPEIFLRDESC